MGLKSFRSALLLGAAALGVGAASAALTPAFAQEATRTYSIGPQELDDALREFGRQTGRDILFAPDAVAGKRSPGAEGQMTERQALEALLAGTGLTFQQTASNGYAVQDPASPTQLGAADTTPSDADAREEIVVVGTRIRGAAPVGSPAYDISREELEQAGHGSAEEILRSIPQNVGDAASPQSALIGSSSQSNYSLGTGANLRGLGAQSTLTLIDGRRVAPSGSGNFTDLSIVPISAIERVEILLDGASAIYGSDAIGGAVNVVLRERYEGVEASYRHGWTSQGGGEEDRVSITAGGDAGPMSALLGYEYFNQEGILANDRDFGGNPPAPQSLLPDQERQSVFARASADLTPNVEIAVTGLYADRSVRSESFDQFAGNAPFTVTRDNQEYSLTADLLWSISDNWRIDLFGGYSQNDIANEGPFSVVAETARANIIELSADGPLLRLPGGPARMALGVGTRNEELKSDANFFPLTSSRDVTYAFLEFAIPIIGPENSLPLVRTLDVSLAGRYEEYSDFGSTENPKVGVLWEIFDGVALRASYGTSFRAPSFFDLDESGTAANLIFDLPDSSGTTRSILLFGGNPNLQPEKSETFTAGLEWQATQSLRLSAGYYDIDYRDRIAAVEGSIFPSLTDPALSPIVVRRGSLSDAEFNALVLAQLQRPPVFGCGAPLDANGFCTEDPSNFGALVDRRTLNLGVVHTSGFDLNIEYFDETALGDIALRFSITAIDEFSRQITEDAPSSDVLDTFGGPLSLSLHGGVSLTRDAVTLAANISYDTDYQDFQGTGSQPIDSWTTVDLYGSYEFDRSIDDDRGLRVSLSVRNVFDEDPPTVPNNLNLFAVGYDPAHANPVGRQLAIELRQAW